jgi:hypothetical protein
MLHHAHGVVAIRQNVQQIGGGHKVEAREDASFALHIIGQSLLTDLQLPLLLLKVLHQIVLWQLKYTERVHERA